MLTQEPVRLLFLDCDGVLNTPKTREAAETSCNSSENFWVHHHATMISKPHLDIIRTAVERHTLHVVISSIWREYPIINMQERDQTNTRIFCEMFSLNDWIDPPILGATSMLGGIRGEEINAWIVSRPDLLVTDYIIIDDDCDFTEIQMKHHAYITDGWYGVTSDFIAFCNKRWK